jgi:hypothetical protein
MDQLRALIFIPIEWEIPSRGNVDASEALPELRPNVLQESGWFIGPLETLAQSGIPSVPFNRLIYFDLPPKLRNLHGYLADDSQEIAAVGERKSFRANVNLIANPVKTGIDGIYCEAVELFGFHLSYPNDSETSHKNLIALHLVANDVPANLENFISFTRLWNQSLIKILSSLFITPSSWLVDYSPKNSFTELPNYHDENMANGGKSVIERVLDLRWRIPKEITKMNCVIFKEGETNSCRVDGGNLFITGKASDKEIALFRTHGAFLGALIAVLKAQSDIFQSSWPVLLEKTDSEVIKTRAWLEQFMNQWWWNRISSDGRLQSAYIDWTSALGIEQTFTNCREDLKEYWAIKTMQNSLAAADTAAKDLVELEKLNKLAKIFAIFGIIPAWLALIFVTLPSYLGIPLTLVALTYLIFKPNSIMKLVEQLQNRMKSD